jgi:hypothetical protein
MMQKTTRAALLAMLLAMPAAAAPPLPPGHPAGTRNAQTGNNQAIFVGVGLLTIGIGVYLASGDYKTPASSASTGTH